MNKRPPTPVSSDPCFGLIDSRSATTLYAKTIFASSAQPVRGAILASTVEDNEPQDGSTAIGPMIKTGSPEKVTSPLRE
jgi:hypothetical protein